MLDRCLLALPLQLAEEYGFVVLKLIVDSSRFPSDLRSWEPSAQGGGSWSLNLDHAPDSVRGCRVLGNYRAEELDDLVLEGYPPVYRWDGARWKEAVVEVKWRTV